MSEALPGAIRKYPVRLYSRRKQGLVLVVLTSTILSFVACAGSGSRGKLSFVSIDEEVTLGKALAAQSIKQLKLIRNQAVTQFFSQIAAEIGAQSDWSGLSYSVNIVNEPDLNHFSLPGGHIYLFRGLIDSASTASEIALIIAHEIAHIAARDGVQRVGVKYAYAFAAQSVVGTNPEIAYQIISQLYSEGTILDYPKDQEFSADKTAIKYAWKANYDPDGLLNILEKLRAIQVTAPEKVSLLLLTHPSTNARYKRAHMEIADVPRKSSLLMDLPEFQTIKQTLNRIPY